MLAGFAAELERWVGRDLRCIPLANGTAALMVALRALTRSTTAREVLMPSFTFAATASAVLWAG